MGATNFHNEITATNANEAFATLVREAQLESGERGYTGTIAEKPCFHIFVLAPRVRVTTFIKWVHAAAMELESASCFPKMPGVPENMVIIVHRAAVFYADKWGPAVCVQKRNTKRFTFFGTASQ